MFLWPKIPTKPVIKIEKCLTLRFGNDNKPIYESNLIWHGWVKCLFSFIKINKFKRKNLWSYLLFSYTWSSFKMAATLEIHRKQKRNHRIYFWKENVLQKIHRILVNVYERAANDVRRINGNTREKGTIDLIDRLYSKEKWWPLCFEGKRWNDHLLMAKL